MKTNSSQEADEDRSTLGRLFDVSDRTLTDAMPWDNSDPFFSAYTREVLHKVLKCYVRQLIVFVGIPGNIMSCLVFFKQGLSDRINLLLFWLAVADLTNLMAQLLLMPGCYLVDSIQVANWNAVGNMMVYANWWASYVSGTLVVVVSVDRCLSVAIPFKAKRLLTYRATAAAIVLSYLVPLVFFLHPLLVGFTITWRTDPSTNRSIAYLVKSPWFPGDSALIQSIFYVCFLAVKSVLLVAMITCCTITITNLHRASRSRKQMTVKMQEEGEADNRITKMLLVLCCIYLISILPEMCSSFVSLLVSSYFLYQKYHNTFTIVYQFLWIASCVNTAANFFAYVILSSRFRRTLVGLFHCFKNN